MEPTPGGVLEDVVEMMSDPARAIVAHLAKLPMFAGNTSVALVDLVECDFLGYAPVPLILDLDNAVEEDGFCWLSPQTVEFEVGAIVEPQLVTAIYITDAYTGVAPTLLTVIPFHQPVVVREPNSTLPFEVNLGGLTEVAG